MGTAENPKRRSKTFAAKLRKPEPAPMAVPARAPPAERRPEGSSRRDGATSPQLGPSYAAGPVFSLHAPAAAAVQRCPECGGTCGCGVGEPVQAKCAACAAKEASEKTEPVQLWDCTDLPEPTCVQSQEDEAAEPVQSAGVPARDPRLVQREARRGLRDASRPLPHGSRIQAAFGRHDVSRVRASVGEAAGSASRRMGALAFTSGDRIGFRGAPSLRLAAHEAAHVVQQRRGLELPDNVGRAGDRWERHADLVADAVVAGRSAEPLLDQAAAPGEPASGGGGPGAGAAPAMVAAPAAPVASAAPAAPAAAAPAVQRQITSSASRLFEPPPKAAEAPAPAAGGGAGAKPGRETAEKAAPGAEGSALEKAEEGDSEAPPQGTPGGATPAAGGASTSAGGAPPASPANAPAPPASAPSQGGGINAPCYNVDPPPPPENAPEPTSDDQGAKPEAKPQVTFEAWPAEVDDCPAEAAVAQAGQQMPGAVGGAAGGAGVGGGAAAAGGAAPTGGPAAAGGAAAAAAGAGPAATAAGGGPAAAGREAPAASGGAAAPADQGAAEPSAMEGQIATTQSERDAAITDYLTATDGLGDVVARSRSLGPGVTFPSAEGSREPEARQAAIGQVQAFMSRAADQITAAVGFAREQVPGRLGGLAETTKSNIQGAIETEKAAISDRIALARAQARAGAAAARGHVHGEYANSLVLIEASTRAALAALDAEHETSLRSVDEKETAGLDDVDSRFATGRTRHEDKGPEYATKAIEKGQEHAHAYERCKGDYSDDGFWDGCLTVRRAKAQQDAACTTAAGYKDVFLRTANKKGYDLRELRKQYRCAVIAGARQVNQTLDQTHEQLVSGLESGRQQALSGIALARDQNLAAIGDALSAALRSLAAQERSQRQAVNDTGYLKQLAVEQLAHSGAANLARGISTAMDSLERTLTGLREGLAKGGVPEPEALARTLAGAEAALGGGMGTLLGTMETGAQKVETQLGDLGAAALEALLMLTTSNGEACARAESGFAAQMSGVKSGATKAFGKLTETHVDQAQTAATEGTTSMKQAVAGFEQALGTIGGKVDGAIATSLEELDRDLRAKLGELDGQIASEAWKAAEKEQPAWKKVLAIVLVILVIIAAAVISIVTLGAGASLFAVILVGALVGAVSGGLIQIINNLASGEEWHEGLVQAMVMGAIGGAIGGGLGFAGGALAAGAAQAGARAVSQLAITAGADLLSEGITQTIGYVAFGQEFSWQGFVTAGAMSGVSFRAAPGGRPRAGAPRPEVPTPSAAGSAAGRRAAVAQVAGGATVGLGVEYAAAEISGQEFDLTRAASAAASGAVGARMARRGAPAGPAAEPKTRLGRASERLRTFDPGGVGARLETGLQGLGGRAFGPRPGVEGAAGASPPRTTAEPPPETTRPRPAADDELAPPSERRAREVSEMKPDSDLAAPGAARQLQLPDGTTHTVSAKRTPSGEVVLTSCSNCQILRDRLRLVADSLPNGPEKTRARNLTRQAAELQRRINAGEVPDIAAEVQVLADRVRAAAAMYPQLEWTLRGFLEGVEANPRVPVAPETGGRIDAGTEADFARVTGGTARSGWFEPDNAFSKSARGNPQRVLDTAWEWYQKAKTGDKRPAIGEFREVEAAVKRRKEEREASTDPSSTPPELNRLFAPPKDWQYQVNDAWIAGHIERGSTFEVVSNPTRGSFLETRLQRGKGDRVQSVFGRELQILERHGYRFVQDAGPKDPGSTRGIKGRMVPPSEVAKLQDQGYVWIPYETPEGRFQGITGRWVKPAAPAKP